MAMINGPTGLCFPTLSPKAPPPPPPLIPVNYLFLGTRELSELTVRHSLPPILYSYNLEAFWDLIAFCDGPS